MGILSLEFIALTLGTVIVYYIVPLKIRWLVLLVASAVFYTFSGWQGCIWLVLVALETFLASLLQERLLKKEQETYDIETAMKNARAEEEKAAADVAVQGIAATEVVDQAAATEAADQAAATEAAEQVSTAQASMEMPAVDATVEQTAPHIPTLPENGWFSSSARIRKLRKLVLAIALILPFLAMAVTKYYDSLRALITSMPQLTLIIPLGLSYFTFQSAAYMIDVYRGKFPAERNPLKYLLFLGFFPQMTQGPIATYPQLMPQLAEGHRFDPDNFVMGVQLAMWGFFKKMVIADRLAYVTAAVNANQKGWFILLTVIIYAIRLYTDFSGGMDVIRGAAKMLGIDVVENFRRPFFSFSVAEYWRRRHISLGNWFKNYLFYPLTTSGFGLALSKIGRKLFGKKAGRMLPATVANIIIFFLIGIWHTANGNAVIFGLYFGLVLGIELLLDPSFRKLKKKLHINEKNIFWKIFTLIRTWILILLPQYFAFTSGPDVGWKLLRNTFRNWDFTNAGQLFTDISKPLEWYIVAAAFVVLLVVDLICEKKPNLNQMLAKGFFLIRWAVLLVLILSVLIFGVYGTGFDASAFLYTHF